MSSTSLSAENKKTLLKQKCALGPEEDVGLISRVPRAAHRCPDCTNADRAELPVNFGPLCKCDCTLLRLQNNLRNCEHSYSSRNYVVVH